MSASHLRLARSETRQLADDDRLPSRLGDPTDWHLTNSAFFTAFVAIAAVLAVLALILR